MSKKNKKGVIDREILRGYSQLTIPTSIFRNRPLTTYEALIIYLKDSVGFNYHNIAVLLDRNERGIRIVYFRGKNKLKELGSERVLGKYCRHRIPLVVLRNRPLTTYEALIVYLKDDSNLNYHNIAELLGRDERDVRKVYFRAKLKNG